MQDIVQLSHFTQYPKLLLGKQDKKMTGKKTGHKTLNQNISGWNSLSQTQSTDPTWQWLLPLRATDALHSSGRNPELVPMRT